MLICEHYFMPSLYDNHQSENERIWINIYRSSISDIEHSPN